MIQLLRRCHFVVDAAEKLDEFAPITSSAPASSVGGTSRPNKSE
jgi:hypothetical protein